MSEDEAREHECGQDRDKHCAASVCMGWRWYKWKAGAPLPVTAGASGPTGRLVIDGKQQGYCGHAGPGEYS